MRFGSIDIGTNTVLLLVADIDDNGNTITLDHRQHFPRIGKNVDASKLINLNTFETVADILREYKTICEQHNVQKIIAVATSAVRDARNGDEFIAYLKNRTGIAVKILTGEEEAEATFLGAVSGLNPPANQYLVIDIGGGSTEVTFIAENRTVIDKYSFNIGAVRVTEKFFKQSIPTSYELIIASYAIKQKFREMQQVDFKNKILVGVAGTATTLACLDQKLMEFDVTKVSGYVLTVDKIQFWLDKLSRLTSNQIGDLSNATHGREDILTAGILILYTFVEMFAFNQIVVSECGLRYGVILKKCHGCTSSP